MEQILKIRLEFEDMSKSQTAKMDKNLNATTDAWRKGMHNAAIAGNDAAMEMMSGLQQAWKDFDWAHPIRSMKNLMSAIIDDIGKRFGKIGQIIFGGIVAGLAWIAKNAINQIRGLIDAQEMVVKMYSQLEEQAIGFGKSVGQSLKEITSISFQTGDAIAEVAQTYTTLGSMRVPVESLQNLTKLAHLGAYALGAERGQLTQLIGTLKVVGRVSDELIGEKGMMGEFLKVQAAVGLTDTEMSGLMNSVSKTTMRMAAFGAKGKDIVAMATVTARLTGLFGKLGLGADRAAEMMDKLMDPTRVAENALQIRMMGMSMSEYLKMLKGGTVDQTKMTKGLVTAAREVARLAESTDNVYAIQARAQMLGFSNMEEALRIAKEGDKMLDSMTGKEADLNKQAAEGMSSLKNAWQTLGNTFGAIFAKPLAAIMGKLTDFLVRMKEVMLEWLPEIEKGFATFFKKLEEWVKGGGIERLVQSIKNFIKGLSEAWKFLQKWGPTLAIVIGSIMGLVGALKLLGPLIGGGGGAAGGGASGGLSGLAKSLQGFAKVALVGVALLLIAGAIWILSDALNKFNTVEWSSLAKAGVVLLVLIGVMIALGALFMSPAGAALLAGVGMFIAISLGIAAFAGSLLLLNLAISKFDASPLVSLSQLADGKMIVGLAKFGLALAAMIAPMMLIGPLALVKMAALSAILNSLSGLGEIEEPLSRIPGYITALAASMAAFGANGSAVDKFIGFSKSLRDMDGQKLNVAFQSAAIVPVTGKLEGVQGDLTQNISASFNASTKMVVDAITDLKTMLSEKEDANLSHLYDIAKNTKRMTRA